MPELNWVGKDKVITHHLDVPYRVLERQYSYDETGQHAEDNGSENMIIHGDNLEALKALLPKYEGKVDCIYIDPPYNTGNEGWVYNDAVNDPRMKKWLGEVVGKEGEDLSRHDKWLCMMYPRLRLLHRLLAPTGVIFISIDDNEVANLTLICDEIFGSSNRVAGVCVGNNQKGRSDAKYFASAHEYLLVYRKTSELKLGGFEPGDHITSRYRKKDPDGRLWREIDLRKTGSNSRREDRPNMFFPIYWNREHESASVEYSKGSIPIFPMMSENEEGRWRWGVESVEGNSDKLFARYMPSKKQWSIFEKDYLDSRDPVTPTTLWLDKAVNSERGSEMLAWIFAKRGVFDYPKPVGYLEMILGLVIPENALILDSFAGAGSSAHAVLNLNKADQQDRKFILIELGDYADSITAERVKRVIDGYGSGKTATEGTGGSFSFYELGAPLFVDGDLNPEVPLGRVREYIWFTETGEAHQPGEPLPHPDFLGRSAAGVSYFFAFDSGAPTVLDRNYLATIPAECGAESYVIYADTCVLSDHELARHSITFKKIPRDITRL